MSNVNDGNLDDMALLQALEEENRRLKEELDNEKQRRAYENDPVFHQTVEMLYHLLQGGQISVPELRAACNLAMNKFAEHSILYELKWRTKNE